MLALGLVCAGPGCLIGSPVAAISGEPYGMTRDDVRAIQGKRGHIWSGAPGFAVVDIVFAAVLDTAFLPVSLLIWGIKALASDDEGDDDHDEGQPHTHGEGGEPHTHGEGDQPHTHGEGQAPAAQDGGERESPAPD